MLLPDKVVSWREGPVDRAGEHMELRYGSFNPGGWDDCVPVLLIAPPVNGVVTVEFLLDRDDPDNAEVVEWALRDIQFYLIDECEIGRPVDFHPWNYAIYHCGTMSNLYSRYHWSHVEPEAAHGPPQPTVMPDGRKGYFRPDQALREDGVDPLILPEELDFLWWLRSFVGSWALGDATWEVGRTPNGYLEVWPQEGRATPSLTVLLQEGAKIADAPGPLGPRPVYFTEELARVWLAPEEYPALLAGRDTPGGGERLLERIEQRILEHDEADQKQGWFWLWTRMARVQPMKTRDRYRGPLRARYRASLRHPSGRRTSSAKEG